jgi:gamma-glutamylputrescine oxidase
MDIEERVYWYEQVPASTPTPLAGRVSADAVVVGGGIAGLSAAQRLVEEGLNVALVEADTCGAGATGRSSGFITPDSELQLADLARRFGDDTARRLYAGARAACDHIRATVRRHDLRCDLVECDSVYAALDEAGARTLREEHEVRRRLGFASTYLDRDAVPSAVASRRYAGAVRYGDTFAINAAAYAAGLRDALVAQGMAAYERSPVTSVGPGVVTTRDGEVRAPRVILCLDRFAPSLGVATRAVHHARAYLTLTEALDRDVIDALFPAGPVMLWDTDLIYQYLRPTAEGRILVGGGALSRTYVERAGDPGPVYAKLERYLQETFPVLRGVAFTHRWQGLIGVTKDILPLAGAGCDGDGAFHALAGAGLPWSVTAGRVAAERALSGAADRGDVFDPGRAFTTLDPLQPLLGKPLTWMLAYPLARSVERGGSAQVRARQRVLGAVVLAGLGALAWAAWRRRR